MKNILLIDFLIIIFFIVNNVIAKLFDPYGNYSSLRTLLLQVFEGGLLFGLPIFVTLIAVVYTFRNSANSHSFEKSLLIPLNYGLFINFVAFINGLVTKQGDGYGWIFLILIATSIITFFVSFLINFIIEIFIISRKRSP